MKPLIYTVVLTLGLAFTPLAYSQDTHQKVEAEAASTAEGKSALESDLMVSMEQEDETVAQIKAELPQWGYVAFWIGIPAPEGNSTIRFRVYNTGEPAAKFIVYIMQDETQKMIAPLELPGDAAANAFINIDIPVEFDSEYSGIILKKAEDEPSPSLWLDSVSVVLGH